VQQPGSLLARDSYTSFSTTSLVSHLGSTGASPLKRSARSPFLVYRPGWDTHPGNWPDPPKERNRFLCRSKGSYSDRKRALKWVLLVTVPRTVLDDATNLEMGPGNDAGASTDSVSQPGPKEVSTDCVRQARPQAVLRASAAHSSGRSCSVDRRLIST